MLSVELIRDYASFFIAIVSSYIYFTDGDYKIISHFIATYLVIDFFINKKLDLYIHHAIGLILYSFLYQTNVSEYSDNFMKPFVAVEISTVFYSIKFLYPKNYFSGLNNLLFVVTFFYYRIYNYYYSVLLNDEINYIIEKTGPVTKYCYYSAIYNLYALNLYWFWQIIKIILKKLR